MITIELTPEQQAQLDHDTAQPATILNPRSNARFVMLPAAQYAKMRPWSPRRIRMEGLKWIALGVVCLIVWGVMRGYHTAQAVHSATNMRDIGLALFVYAHDHAGRYPDNFGELLVDQPELKSDLFIAPWGSATPATGATPQERAAQMTAGGHCSYGYLGAGRTDNDTSPADVMAYEADGTNPIGGVFCLFGDGHGESLSTADAIQAIIATVTKPAVKPH